MLVIDGKEVFTTIEELVNPKYTALLLIDLQNDYVSTGGYSNKLGRDLFAIRQVVQPVMRVLQAARDCGILIVHIQMTFYSGSLAESPVSLWQRMGGLSGHKKSDSVKRLMPVCIDGTWGWQIADGLAPLPKEVIVKKHRPSAFVGTDLDMILRSNNIKSVAITGVLTAGCVLATAIDASFFNYYPVILRDCIAGTQPELHDAALLIMDRITGVAASTEVLEVWARTAT